jgi:hypothetical protein
MASPSFTWTSPASCQNFPDASTKGRPQHDDTMPSATSRAGALAACSSPWPPQDTGDRQAAVSAATTRVCRHGGFIGCFRWSTWVGIYPSHGRKLYRWCGHLSARALPPVGLNVACVALEPGRPKRAGRAMPPGQITCSGARSPIHRRRRLHPAAASRDDKSAEACSLWPPVGLPV